MSKKNMNTINTYLRLVKIYSIRSQKDPEVIEKEIWEHLVGGHKKIFLIWADKKHRS